MNRYLLAAVALWGLLAACTEDRTQEEASVKTVVRTVRIEAAAPGQTGAARDSRTELAPDGFSVLWSPGDRIGVYVKSGATFTTLNAPLEFTGSAASATGEFSGEITLADGTADYTLYAYYPYAETSSPDATAVPFTLPAEQMQAAAGSSTQLGDYDFLVAGAVTSTTGDFSALAFRHAFAVVEADLTASGVMAGKQVRSVALFATDASSVAPNGSLTNSANMAGGFSFDLTAGEANNTANYTGGSAQVGYAVVGFSELPTLGAEPLKVYAVINPADYSRGNGRIYVVVRTTDGYTATYSRPGLTIAAGQMKVITQAVGVGVAPEPVIDLSGTEARANCYIASVPSQEYSFDATVAGNGLITPGLAQAVATFEGRTLSAVLSGTTAKLLWQSRPYLIEPGSVRYEAGRIYFSLTERPTLLGGNAVVGLYTSADPVAEAVWSWHIWITDKSNEELTAAAETYLLSGTYEAEYGSGSVQMMDRNLGAIYKEDDAYARSFRAPLYQWGRKDAFPWGTVVYDEQSAAHNYIAENPPVQSTGAVGQYVGYTGNTYYATAHPDVFIATTQASSYDWYYGGGQGNGPTLRNDELWGNPTGYQVGQKGLKTLFDPCPAGWMIPHPYAFSGFTKNGNSSPANELDAAVVGSFVQGWNFRYDGVSTTYYPGVGFRYDEFGLFAFTPSGYYWGSAPAPADTFGAWVFGLTSAQIFQRVSNPRGFGFPVRCMRDLPTP